MLREHTVAGIWSFCTYLVLYYNKAASYIDLHVYMIFFIFSFGYEMSMLQMTTVLFIC